MKNVSKIFNETKKEYGVINTHPIAKSIVDSLISVFTVALLILILWNTFDLVLPQASLINIVSGESMSPTLKDGQIMFSDVDEVERGDIVVLRPHISKGASVKYMVKRVVGMPGDRLIIKKDGVYINDKKYDEWYLTEDHKKTTYIDGACNSVLLDDGEYFVMGDNRDNSNDSRIFGVVYKDEVVYPQSVTPTANTFFKVAAILLMLALMTILYGLIEFIVKECAYAILSKCIENKKTKGDNKHGNNA